MILGQLRMRARQTKNAPLTPENMSQPYQVSSPFFIASIATLSPFSNLICCKYPQGSLHLHKMLPVRILLLPHIAEMVKTVNASTVNEQIFTSHPFLTLTMFKVAIVFLIKFLCNRGFYQPTRNYFVIYGRCSFRSFDLLTQSPKISLFDCMEVKWAKLQVQGNGSKASDRPMKSQPKCRRLNA